MKRLIDTSAWIDWLVGSPLAAHIAVLMPPPSDLVVPTIVQLELSKWLTRERGPDGADAILAFTASCQVEPLTTRIALDAADLSQRLGLSTADAIIYATARDAQAELVTCDSHFEGLEGVALLDKRRSPPP